MVSFSPDSVMPWDGVKILVVGDLILDEYLDGTVTRISPEAPVPVHLVRNSVTTAGGAANVARNIQLVGGEVILAGVCGKDQAAEDLKGILQGDGILTHAIQSDEGRPTVRKTRITANHQQLVRIDWEETKPISNVLQQSLLSVIEREQFDAILLSDYGKGGLPKSFLQALFTLANKRKVPVAVDPKGNDYSIYQGCDLITPNRKEACDALGLDINKHWPAEKLARELQSRFNLKHVLVTLGAEGMYGLSENGEEVKMAAVTREVFDVSGAGDTVVAMMTLCAGARMKLKDAMVYANAAAGRVVEKWGTQPILRSELLEALKYHSLKAGESLKSQARSAGKVSQLDDLLGYLASNRANKKIVFTNGCFDLLHVGHVSYLEEARSYGDLLIVGVNSDSSIQRLKGKTRPVITAEQRVKVLSALECVDFVVTFDQDTPIELIEAIKPDVLVKGADYEISEIVGADLVMGNGGEVHRIKFVDGISTSEIIRRLRQED